MESIQLPSELLLSLMMLSAIEDVLRWCNSAKSINLICQDKINREYPNYAGLPYKDSYRETGKLLVWGKYINERNSNVWSEWYGNIYSETQETVSLGMILVNGKTTFNSLAKGEMEEEVDYFFYTKKKDNIILMLNSF